MSRMAGWWVRLKHLVLRREEQELDEELAFHLDHLTEEYIAEGMEPGEARRQARIEFGGVEQSRQRCRETRPGLWLDRLAQDVRYALRGFRRNPVFTLTILATLTIGIGATTAVFSVVDRILFRPLPYAHGGRVVSVGMVQPLEPTEFMVGGFYYDWKDHQKPFEAMAAEAASPQECDLTERNPQHLPCSRIEAGLLPMLGVSPVLGRNFLPEEDLPNGPKVTLISYNVWLNRYNRDHSILNRFIDVDGVATRVVGVLPKGFALPTLHAADLVFPLAKDVAAQRRMNPGAPVRAFARLKPGVSVEQAQLQMEPLFQQARKMIPGPIRNEFRLKVRSLRDRQMEEVRPIAWVLFGTALAVLLIACANVASLMMARGATRQQELAVRSALGASRFRLAAQALIEAILLSFTGALAGLLLAEGLLRLFVAIAPAGIPFLPKAQLDLRIILFTIVTSVVCGLVFGLGSAWQRPGIQVLSGRTLIGNSSAKVRQGLVMGQIAMSLILLVIAMLLVRSFRLLENQKLGIRTDNALTLSITLGGHDYPTAESEMKFFQQLEERMKYGPGVSAVAMSDSLPPAQNHRSRRLNSIFVEGKPPLPEDSGPVTFRWVSPDYFRAMYIPIVQGEGFREEEVNSDEGRVVLSQTLANRLFPSRDAVGQRILLNGPESRGAVAAKGSSVEPEQWWTVVGVAADVKNGGLSGDELPEYYKLRRNRAGDWGGSGVWDRTGVLVLRSSLPSQVLAEWARSQLTEMNPTLPVDIATLNQRVSTLADQPRFQTALVGSFAASGLAMAVIGLYGVLAFLVAQREREIGVRMALGASRREILQLVMRRSLRLIVCGLAVGLVLALMASRALSHMLFHVGPWDPVSYLATIALLVIVGLLATWLPARSACNVDPAVALRAE
jgi:putative ABC transport system permease protein